MIKACRLAWSLIRIPHVTFTLFLFPMIGSLLLVLGQLIGTGIVVRSVSADARLVAGAMKQQSGDSVSLLRYVLHGSGLPRPALKVCRWQPDPNSITGESPPGAECAPDRLDVAIQAGGLSDVEIEQLASWFEGQVDRVHICERCSPDVVLLRADDGTPRAHALSVYGLGVLGLGMSRKDGKMIEKRSEYIRSISEFQETVGRMSFFIPESNSFVELSAENVLMPFTANAVLLTIIALWLALRAHRKVLDYFSQNGVLLPLVAATGKKTFYSAIWILTFTRVACFLGVALPMCYIGLHDISGDNVVSLLRPHARLIGIWAVVLVTTLAFLTTVSSIADLKRRASLLAFVYRYVPFVCAFVGAAAWAASFLLVGEGAATFRLVLSSLPVLGLMPLMMAPVLQLPLWVLVFHGTLSLVALLVVLRANTTWFAAHLEEV